MKPWKIWSNTTTSVDQVPTSNEEVFATGILMPQNRDI